VGIAHWFMVLGGSAEVISPPSLKEKVKHIAETILEKLK